MSEARNTSEIFAAAAAEAIFESAGDSLHHSDEYLKGGGGGGTGLWFLWSCLEVGIWSEAGMIAPLNIAEIPLDETIFE
jgi:hypothetical protein